MDAGKILALWRVHDLQGHFERDEGEGTVLIALSYGRA